MKTIKNLLRVISMILVIISSLNVFIHLSITLMNVMVVLGGLIECFYREPSIHVSWQGWGSYTLITLIFYVGSILMVSAVYSRFNWRMFIRPFEMAISKLKSLGTELFS